MVKKIPDDFHSVTPSLVLSDAASAIKLYEQAFNAQELYRMECPDGTRKIMHACITLGDSKIFVSDANQKMGSVPSVSSFYVYVEDVDTIFAQAKKAGLNEIFPVQDMFWGDRTGTLKDSYGNSWTLATHVRDVSPEEMEAGRKKMAAGKAS